MVVSVVEINEMTLTDTGLLLLKFAALRQLPNRVWDDDPKQEVKRFRKTSPELHNRIASHARPDELMRLAVAYGLAGKDTVAKHYATVAFNRAEKYRRIDARYFRFYTPKGKR